MRRPTPPSFDEWVNYCFTQGYADFGNDDSGADVPDGARLERFTYGLDAQTLADYLIDLLGAPAALAETYTPDQLASGVWFVFSSSVSSYISRVAQASPDDLRLCVAALPTLYKQLFDPLCQTSVVAPDHQGNRQFEPDLTDSRKLDMSVYMLWDLDLVGHIRPKRLTPSQKSSKAPGKRRAPDSSPADSPASPLLDTAFDSLQTILAECSSGACLKSALHALGHLHTADPQRVRQITDRFLHRPNLPRWTREYASAAREGHVQ